MAAVRRSAFVLGLLFLVLGVSGLFPQLLWVHPIRSFGGPHSHTSVGVLDGYLFGLFHVNVIHSGTHVLFGLLGFLAAGWYGLSRLYAVVVTLSYLALVVLGLIPVADTLFGFCPIDGYDVWLHLSLAGAALPFAFLPIRVLDGPAGP